MKILGVSTLAIKNIMGVEVSSDEPGVIKTVVMDPALPEWSTDVPNAMAGGSLRFPQTMYNLTTDNAALGCLDVPYASGGRPSGSVWSVQAWFRKTGGDGHNRVIWSLGGGGYANGSAHYIWNNQTPYWNISDNGSGEYITNNSPAAYVTNTWYHVVCTKAADGSNNGKIYINGTLQSSKLSIATYVVDTSGSFTVGLRNSRFDGNRDRGFVGNITEVCFWNVALDQGAVDNLYNEGDGAIADTVSGSNIAGYWRMLEGSGITVSGSATGSAYDGTLKTFRTDQI